MYIQQGGHHVGHWPTFLVENFFKIFKLCRPISSILKKDRILMARRMQKVKMCNRAQLCGKIFFKLVTVYLMLHKIKL